MSLNTTSQGRSADVKLQLIADGVTLDLAQVGRDFVIVSEPRKLPPCDAEVVVSIDGRPDLRCVRLVDGLSESSRIAKISRT